MMEKLNDFKVLVMAGGSGKRFWPESTKKCPKQYLQFKDNKTLLELTLERFGTLALRESLFIVTTASQQQLALKYSKEFMEARGIILEPCARNTAPCILLAITDLLEKFKVSDSDVLAIMPADHMILNKLEFEKTLRKAHRKAKESNKIVTIGIPPNQVHTGYGYIQRGKAKDENIFEVLAFKEKPNQEQALKYFNSGEFYWNAGMFVASIKTLLNEFEQHAPNLFKYHSLLKKEASLDVYKSIPSISIDYAIMEKSKNIVVVESSFDWNDLGSWDALETVIAKEENNFFTNEKVKKFIKNSKGNIVKISKDKMVTLINVNDLVIVENDKNIMVIPKKEAQNIKEVVEYLEKQEWGEGFC